MDYKTKDKNYDQNLVLANKLITEEIRYEDERYLNINKKATFFLGFISLLIILILKIKDGDLSMLKEVKFVIPAIYVLYFGLGLLLIAIVASLIALKPRKYSRPNLSIKEDGLLYVKEMEKTKLYYDKFILANLQYVLNINIEQNEDSTGWLLLAYHTFTVAIIMITLILLMGV